MQIAISITTHNRYKTFKQSYDQMMKYLPDGAKIVVIDDGSDIPCPEATFRFETPHGIAAAKNKAFELTQGADYHFAFDDDIFPIVKDWHLPYINSGQNHLCFTYDKFKNGKASGRVLIGLAKELKIYKDPCGCMLFYTKKALDTVGGMDIEYGRWAYEHVGHSMRIHNAGLTSLPFMDIADSLKLFYSLDWAQEVIRSLDPKIRKALAPRNEMKYNREKKSKKYISFMPPRDLILTSYFTGQKDPQRNERWVVDITKLDTLIDSLQGCKLIIFNDCFDGDEYRGCELIKTKIDINPYFARWAAYLSYIKSNTSVNLVAWFNVPKYGLMDDFCTSQSYFSNLLFKALNFKATSPIYSMAYTILSDISTFNNPFERWSYDYQRVTLPPYTYVHLIIGITGKISAGCIPDYDPLTQDYCVEL